MESTDRQAAQLRWIKRYSIGSKVSIFLLGFVLVFFTPAAEGENTARYLMLFLLLAFVCVGIEVVWASNVTRIANTWLSGVGAVVLLLAAVTYFVVFTQTPRDAMWLFGATCITWVVLVAIEARLKKRAKAS
ncbi:MAG: hypothetical protein HLX46_08565 [Corynebacterium sp.]|uniref:hypothetical protein n=1 Tax=Corynebacterium sp. TaxID=1720 RepID=UPI00183C1851|nr:hypothetical protein [Corynebacterium sp.]NWO16866.1 hypothetical protein [Corynebacterium sp.]